MNKKGYLKTLEAIIAVIIVFMVVIISLSFDNPETEEVPPDVGALQDTIFDKLQNDVDYREYVFDGNIREISSFLDAFVDNIRFEYGFVICDNNPECAEYDSYPQDPIEFPEDSQIYADSFVIQKYEGETFNFKLFRLYIWYKEL